VTADAIYGTAKGEFPIKMIYSKKKSFTSDLIMLKISYRGRKKNKESAREKE